MPLTLVTDQAAKTRRNMVDTCETINWKSHRGHGTVFGGKVKALALIKWLKNTAGQSW